jgi:hypothetical protein
MVRRLTPELGECISPIAPIDLATGRSAFVIDGVENIPNCPLSTELSQQRQLTMFTRPIVLLVLVYSDQFGQIQGRKE